MSEYTIQLTSFGNSVLCKNGQIMDSEEILEALRAKPALPSDEPSAIQAIKDLAGIYDESPVDIIDALTGTLWSEEESGELFRQFNPEKWGNGCE